MNVGDDPSPLLGDPAIRSRRAPVLPRWVSSTGLFADGSARIRRVHRRLVRRYAMPGLASAALGAADAAHVAPEDILRHARNPSTSDLGAFER